MDACQQMLEDRLRASQAVSFLPAGCRRDCSAWVRRFTKKDMRDCRKAGSKADGGLFEVCIVDDTWLVGKPEQANVRKDRCITTENDELEPWFFAFRKQR